MLNKKTYFLSDFHLGMDALKTSSAREHLICAWFAQHQETAEALYLVGDVFDAWFEYKKVIPKGYARFFGALATWRDAGIPIYFFTGNHDMWMFQYFSDEFGISIYREPITRTIYGKKFFIGHGDGLGPGDNGYKFIKKIFTNTTIQRIYSALHPNLGLPLMHFFSDASRNAQEEFKASKFLGTEKEWLLQFCESEIKTQPDIDYFIFGHRHLPIDWLLSNGKSRYINLGEWMYATSFVSFDGEKLQIEFFEKSEFSKIVKN